MCGIIGAFSFDRNVEPLDLDMIAHRGPDARGSCTLCENRLWIGHTRLSILDLSGAGAQPMHDPVSGNVIVFNGEIYNHPELRAALPASEKWRGSSDTETLLVAFREWGTEAFSRLRGMFAFALWEGAAKKLWLVRDPLGIKPLYMRRSPNGLCFGSEIRPLMRKEGIGEADRTALSHYLCFGAFGESGVISSGISALRPGAWQCWSDSGDCSEKAFWRPGTSIFEGDYRQAVEETRRRVSSAVSRHLLADVPVAAFLSGGIDSSIVTALAQQASTKPIEAFSVGFREKAWDESAVAGEVAERVGSRFVRIELDEAETLELVVAAVESMDVPSIDGINTYIVSEAVRRKGVKVVLSGLGGDEFFGGYPIFHEFPRWRFLGGLPRWSRLPFRLLGSNGARVHEIPSSSVAQIARWRRRFFSEREISLMGMPGVEPNTFSQDEYNGIDWMGDLSWAEASGYMRHVLLRDSDQMSMAHSLELRVPLLDQDIVEWALSLPAHFKMQGNFNKPLLVKAFEDLLPRSVYDRKKRGFELPMDRWLRGPLAGFVDEGARRLNKWIPELEQSVEVQRKAFAERRIHWTRWWSFVVLGHWMERNLK